MNRRKIIFRDPVVERVVDKFVDRSNVGYDKYGTTLNDERTMKMKGLVKYLTDIQEELMDAILYIQTAREELKDLSDDALVDKCKEELYKPLNNADYTHPEFKEKFYKR